MPNGNALLQSFHWTVLFSTADLMYYFLCFQVSTLLDRLLQENTNEGLFPRRSEEDLPKLGANSSEYSVQQVVLIECAVFPVSDNTSEQHSWTTCAARGWCIQGSKTPSTMDNLQKRNLTFLTIGLIFMLNGIEYGKFIITASWTWGHEIMVSLQQNLPGIWLQAQITEYIYSLCV